jgi:SAM-dependent methyltransferase
MAHPEQAEFFSGVRAHYPASFDGARVLEVGSLDINGSVRELFSKCDYTGVDLQLGPGVDLAVQGQLVEFASGHFDTSISAECLEHNPFWRETVANMLRMTRPGGLVMISCATTGRLEHGTSRTNPDASPFTTAQKWEYYKNLTASDIESSLNLKGWLTDWSSWVNFITRDLYFVGLRHGGEAALNKTMKDRFDARYAMTASAKSLRRGLKTKLFGDLFSGPPSRPARS